MTIDQALDYADNSGGAGDNFRLAMVVLAGEVRRLRTVAKSSLDKLPERWNMGFQAGLKQAIPYEKELTDALTAERKARQDDNTVLTFDIMRLEEAMQRIATDIIPYPTPCREAYLRNIARGALASR